MRPRQTCRWGFAIAAGLIGLSTGTDARAQFSYGYNSWVNVPSAESAYASMGYQNIYTDPTTASFMNGTPGPLRTVAPYSAPPFGAYQQGNGLPTVATRPATVVAAPQRRAVVVRRRGLLFRRR